MDKSKRFRLNDTNKATMSNDRMCPMMGVSPSGLHARNTQESCQRKRDDMVLLLNIQAQFSASSRTYGVPRMHAELCKDGLSIGRHRMARLMRNNGLMAHQKRRFKKTKSCHHDCPVAFNILNQDPICDTP
jgi:putative transposase